MDGQSNRKSARDNFLGLLYFAKLLFAFFAAWLLAAFGPHWDSLVNPPYLAAAGLVLGVCIPDLTVLVLWGRNPDALSLARHTAYVLEIAASAGCVAAAYHVINEGGHGGELGLVPGAIGALIILLAQANLIPFRVEYHNL